MGIGKAPGATRRRGGNRISTPVQTIFSGPAALSFCPHFSDTHLVKNRQSQPVRDPVHRDNLRYFEIIRDNLTSRQGEGGHAPNAISHQLLCFFTFAAIKKHPLQSKQCLVLRVLRIFAAIQSKCLSMNSLHSKSRFSNHRQSRLIKLFSCPPRCILDSFAAFCPGKTASSFGWPTAREISAFPAV